MRDTKHPRTLLSSARRSIVALAAAGITVLSVESTAAAAPDDREQCATSAEQAQQLRDEGKYRRAREQMLVCARDVCPGAIKSDCGKWLTELDRDAPTVVFGARDSKGADVLDVKVSMDGTPISEKLDGKPLLVDSGEHTFKFESKDGAVKEERVLLRAAEKARPIIATFPGKTTGPEGAQPPPAGGESTEGSIVPSLVVGGIGVLGLASFAIFGLSGKGEVDELNDSKCKPNCDESKVDSARTKLIVADISLGVGIVALGVATYMFLTRPKVEAKVQTGARLEPRSPSSWRSSLRFDAAPLAGGGFGGVRGTF